MESTSSQTTHTFTFLGTGAGCGVPAFFCGCAACKEAATNPLARRGCCGVFIEGEQRTLIDTPPDLRHQFLREGITGTDNLLYTHAHFDHLGGLGELEYFVRLVKGSPLVTYASKEAADGILQEFHYMDDCLEMRTLAPFDSVELDRVRYTALPVVHAPGTFGYLIETPETRLFYACDTAKLTPEICALVDNVDYFILDATFWNKNLYPKTHHSIQETAEEGLALGAKTVYLTHLSMHYTDPVTLEELEAFLERYGGRVKVAHDGLKLAI